ncbi:hypothetical protein [Listeria booriae]|uniref:hypothetical protein n=1 Tax=Listeria booriae TaxID=1552123 RepID=UPI001E64A71C|nr:hypothetical protein [Listeria booriae]MCD2208585.1 hypothetical protein [Listeria booriae]
MQFLFFWKKDDDYLEEERRKERKKYNRKGERRYKYLASGVVKYYVIGFVFTLLVIISTVGLGIMNSNHYEMVDSGNGPENVQKLAGTNMFLADRTYHPNTHQAEYLFQIEREAIYQKQPIQMIAVERKTGKQLPSRMIELNEEYMLVIVSDIPDDWREVVIDVGENELYVDTSAKVKTGYLLTKEDDDIIKKGTFKQGTFSFSEEKTPVRKGYSSMSTDDYLRYYADRQIKAADKLMLKYQKNIVKMNEDVAHMNKQVKELEEDKKYQIDTVKQETDQDIKSIRSQQEKLKVKVEEIKLGIRQLDARKGKLVEWLQDHPA